VAKPNARSVGFEIVHADIFGVEMQRPARREARFDQIVNDFVLAIDRDGPASRKFRHVDAVTDASEGEVDAVVSHAFPREPIAHADLVHQIDRSLFEHTRAHTFDDMLTTPVFDDDRVDALEVEEVPEHETSRPSAYDAHLSAGDHDDQCSVTVSARERTRRRARLK
jgi:hypothetical protein